MLPAACGLAGIYSHHRSSTISHFLIKDNGAGPLFQIGPRGDWSHIFWSLGDTGAFHTRIDIAEGGDIFGFTSEAGFFPSSRYSNADVSLNSDSLLPNG